jgi:lysine 2,3-aminomutase
MIKRQFVSDRRSENQLSDEDEDPLPHERTNDECFVDIASYLSGNQQQAIKNGIKTSQRSLAFLKKHYPDETLSDWADWRWQIRHCITDASQLSNLLELSAGERDALVEGSGQLPMRITPYYASLLDPDDPLQPLRRTVVPTSAERLVSPGEAADPLCEDDMSPVPGIVHRYPDRVLFLVTGFCSTYCRYCTRSRLVGDADRYYYNLQQWNRAIDYIEGHPEIRDVLISGGDPLTLPDDKIEYLLSRLRKIPHVEIVRIGTKVPVVLPQRITEQLTKMLRKYHPLWINIHFAHPDEVTPETKEACERLADVGIPLGSQTVLLKGVNDDTKTVMSLYHKLLAARVRPYYLYQCDPILGSAHFRTNVEKGIEIIQGLRGWTSGMAVPQYVIDAPGGGGKVPFLPEYFQGFENGFVVMKNYRGEVYRYPEPGRTGDCGRRTARAV